MSKNRQNKSGKGSDARAVASGKREGTALNARLLALEEAVERLSWDQFYRRAGDAPKRRKRSLAVAQARYARATSDGWLVVVSGGVKTSLPSGLKVSLTSSSGGRDYGTIDEGILAGSSFDVTSGNLEAGYRRVGSLQVKVRSRAGGPVKIGGTSYELEMSINYVEGVVSKSAGPFPATTYAGNPLPDGDHDIEIADFPHPGGATYGALGTVWFRLGHSGDRYLHPGRISAGCLTCAPGNWEAIFQIVHCARVDAVTAGKLNMASAMTVAAAGSRRRKAQPA